MLSGEVLHRIWWVLSPAQDSHRTRQGKSGGLRGMKARGRHPLHGLWTCRDVDNLNNVVFCRKRQVLRVMAEVQGPAAGNGSARGTSPYQWRSSAAAFQGPRPNQRPGLLDLL